MAAFVLALIDRAAFLQQFADCNSFNADMNDDGAFDGQDVSPFVAWLLNGECQ